jgi:hypothetical protein
MKLLNELVDEWNISDILNAMNAVLNEYEDLVEFTQLNEGTIDTLGNDVVQQVAEIQQLVDTIRKSRNIIAKLNGNGSFSKKDVNKHISRVTDNKQNLTALLKRTSRKMRQLLKVATSAVNKSKKKKRTESIEENYVYGSDINLMDFGKFAPFILNKADKLELTESIITDPRYADTYDGLLECDLLTSDREITPSGKLALENNRLKRKTVSKVNSKPQKIKEEIEDLTDYNMDESVDENEDDEGTDDISF